MKDCDKNKLLQNITHRGDTLQCLDDGEFDSRDIAEKTNQSRSSIDRDIRLLKKYDFIEETNDGYRLSQYGEYALKIYKYSSHISEAECFMPHLPSNTPFEVLQDAVIREACGTMPQSPIDHITDLVGAARDVKIITPAILPPFTATLANGTKDNPQIFDMVVTEEVLEKLWVSRKEDVQLTLQNSRCKLRQIRRGVSFGLVIADDRVMCMIIYDDSMRLLGTLTNSSDGAVEWAVDTFRDYLDASEDVTTRGAPPKNVATLS